MKVVIDIPEEIVADIKDYCGMSIADAKEILPIILNAIHNGTILPKGHGRLIDADALCKKWVFDAIGKQEIYEAPPIIEADAESIVINRGNKND